MPPVSPLLPGYSSVTTTVTLDEIVGRVEALEEGAAGGAAAGRVDVTASPYNAVADGGASNDSSTDNYAAFVAAMAAAKSSGKTIYVPKGEYDVYFDSDLNDGTAGKHTQLSIDWAGARFVGDGVNQTVIRGKSTKASRGRVASLVGNIITLQTSADSTKFRAGFSIRIAANADGSGNRSLVEGTGATHSVIGPNTLTAVGTGTVTVRDGTRYVGVQVGDYVFADVGFALFRHNYAASALTAAFNLVFETLSLTTEFYGATVDSNGNSNAAWDCGSYPFDSNPQPMGAGTSVFHRVTFDRCKIYNGYSNIHMGEGGANTLAFCHLLIQSTEIYGGANAVHFGNQGDHNIGRTLICRDSYIHDTDANAGSHLFYIHSAASIICEGVTFDGWRAGKYATQHWGSATTAYDIHASWTDCVFGARGAGFGVLTSEHGSASFTACTFESANGIEWRCNTRVVGCYLRPAVASGQGIANYGDAQYKAQLTVLATQWNLVNVVGTGYQGAVILNVPAQVLIRGCSATAIDVDQSSDNDLVRGNTGPFLVAGDGSTGGYVEIDGLVGTFAIQSGAPGNVGWLASLTGASGAAVKFKNVRWSSRPASDRGQIQCQGRTSTDRIEIVDCDITAAAGVSIYTTASLPADVVEGRANRFNAVGSTFVARQRLRGREGISANIASAATVVWDPDYDYAQITGTTTISTMNVTGTSQLGYHGAVATLYAVGGFSTDALGNFFAAYTVAAGACLVVRYDAIATKWIRVGS